MNRAAACALASLLPLVSGCVAAAIPLAAGAAVAKRHAQLEAASARAGETAGASDRSDLRAVRTSLTALPPPTSPAGPANPAIAAFRAYALAQAAVRPGSGRRPSAIVPSAGELRPARSDCGALPPAVFVDLDPGRGAFDPLAPGDPDPALGAALAAVREIGARVVWFSRLGANFAGPVHEALAREGLDPAGSDELRLMPDLGERKQSLRDEVAARLCPVAMLGDERADFDELYLYLRNPDAAIGLDAMIGRGWFLASPFLATAPPASGVTP